MVKQPSPNQLFDAAIILIDLDEYANNYGQQQALNLAFEYIQRSIYYETSSKIQARNEAIRPHRKKCRWEIRENQDLEAV